MCKVNAASNSVEHYYNQGYSSTVADSNNPSTGFSNIKVSINNGVLNCSFTRAKRMATISNLFDLNSPYYVLFATGQISNSIYLKNFFFTNLIFKKS